MQLTLPASDRVGFPSTEKPNLPREFFSPADPRYTDQYCLATKGGIWWPTKYNLFHKVLPDISRLAFPCILLEIMLFGADKQASGVGTAMVQ